MKKATDYTTLLREHGFKATALRIAILEALEVSRTPLTVAKIVRKVRKHSADVESVYRALAAFVQEDIVRAIPLGSNSLSYEFVRDQHGHHIVCTSCAVVEAIPFCVRSIELNAKDKSKLFKSISGHTLSFAGTCKKCARAVR